MIAEKSWGSAIHSRDSKAMTRNFGSVNKAMYTQKDLNKVANALIAKFKDNKPREIGGYLQQLWQERTLG